MYQGGRKENENEALLQIDMDEGINEDEDVNVKHKEFANLIEEVMGDG